MNATRRHALPAIVLLALAACTGAPASSGPSGPAATMVVVALSPTTAETRPGATVAFTATVTGTADTTVAWSVQEGASGGSVSADGLYTAPSTAGAYHVVARSHADPAKFQVGAVTVTAAQVVPVSVSIAPAAAAVDACGSVTFVATVTGTNDPAIVWSVKEEPVGGTVTPGGTYTAPQTAGTYHVVASSLAFPSQLAEATVVVGPEKVLSIAVTPGSTSLTPGGAIAFAATVTTSCGAFAAQ